MDSPLAMYFVVRQDYLPPMPEFLQTVVQATLDSYSFEDDPTWQDNFLAWNNGRFRKICLRAKENEWKRLYDETREDYDPGFIEKDFLLVYAPRKKDDMKFLRKLQVPRLSLEDLPDKPYSKTNNFRQEKASFVINEELNMSLGKIVAQVAHAAQITKNTMESKRFSSWANSGFYSTFKFGDIQENAPVTVEDAGFTEVDPFSKTVQVFF